MAKRGLGIALACRTFGVSETCHRTSPKLDEENEPIADRLRGLTRSKKTWGFGSCLLHLRNVQGQAWTHKRVHRIHRELDLTLRSEPSRRHRSEPDGERRAGGGSGRSLRNLPFPRPPNLVWSMDLMADRLAGGRRLRLPNVPDDFHREGLGIATGFSWPAERVVRAPNQIIQWRGKPLANRVGNGPEHVSVTLSAWAEKQGIVLTYIQPGKPQQNASLERHNRTVRHEWLDLLHPSNHRGGAGERHRLAADLSSPPPNHGPRRDHTRSKPEPRRVNPTTAPHQEQRDHRRTERWTDSSSLTPL